MKNHHVLAAMFLLAFVQAAPAQDKDRVRVQDAADYVEIDTDAVNGRIRKKGYVSGIAPGFLDKKTGARDLGFGLHIMDFLLGPGWKDDTYGRDAKVHGNLPHHFIEGPQICTQARTLAPEIIRDKDAVAVKLAYRFIEGHNGYQAGSLWEQTMIFRPGKRWVLCGERITSANDVDTLIYRIDMPGHIRHKKGDTFSQVYLSYHGTIPAKEFFEDFSPDGRFLYEYKEGKVPKRMIRAYQVKVDGKPGPWLAGMTLDPNLVYQGWCHQRSYICLIEEIFARNVKKGQAIGATYIVGYFDDIAEMNRVYDEHKGTRFQDLLGFRK